MAKGINHQLDMLTDQFYKQNIDEDFNIAYKKPATNSGTEEINEDLLNYYDENKVYFNLCVLSKKLTMGLSQELFGQCKEEGFGDLKASIFQVNYLLKTLKELLIKGHKICYETNENNENNEECETLNERYLGLKKIENFDKKRFDKMRSKVITSLQTIHDCYKDNQSTEKCNTSEANFKHLSAFPFTYLFNASDLSSREIQDIAVSRWLSRHDWNILLNEKNVDSRWEELMFLCFI